MAMMGGQAQSNSSRPSPAGRNGGSSLHGAAAPCSPGRLLPSKELRSDSIEDDYVQFIFYCNPSLSLDLDTAELRRGFQSMPKTDGKSFDVFVLFELIQKLEAKEIETWSQLVVDMGVVPPNVASGQSTQKVQQYAVRLKVRERSHFAFVRCPRNQRALLDSRLSWGTFPRLCFRTALSVVIRDLSRTNCFMEPTCSSLCSRD